jgi:HEAT repeat protein
MPPAEQRELRARALNLLVTAAESELDDISCNAIEALARVAPREGLPSFRKAAKSDSWLVRYAGFAALGEARDAESVPRLRASVQDANPRVRLAVAFALCRCGQTAYAKTLVRTLTDVEDERLRADAATFIGKLEEPQAVKALRAALRYPANEKSKRVTIYINAALAALGDKAALRDLINDSHGGTEPRLIALLALADLGNSEARDTLRYRLGPIEQYPEARLIAARGLARLGSNEGFEYAMQMLSFVDTRPNPTEDDPDRTYPVRSMAIHALAEMRDARALPALRTIAAGSNAALQVAAAYAICRITESSIPAGM